MLSCAGGSGSSGGKEKTHLCSLIIDRHPSSQRLCKSPEGTVLYTKVQNGCPVEVQEPQLPTWPCQPRDAASDTGLGVGPLVVKRRQRPKLQSTRLLSVGVCPATSPPTEQA